MGPVVVGLILAVELVIALAVAWWAADRLLPAGEHLLMVALTTTMLAFAELTGGLLALGAIGQLRQVPFLVLQLLVGAAGLTWRRRAPRAADAGGRWHALSALEGVLLGLTVVLAVIVLRAGANGPSLDNDSHIYHLPHAVQYLNEASTWGIPFEFPKNFLAGVPGNGELIGTWLMLPSREPDLAYLAPLLFAVLLGLAVATIVRDLGRSSLFSGAVGLAMVASPAFWIEMHSLMTDIAGDGGALAAIAFALRVRTDPADRRWPLLAGVAMGFGVGSKYTVLLPAAATALLAVWWSRQRLRAILWIAVGAVPLAGFWFLRNLVQYGNPLFPQGLRVLGRQVLPERRSEILTNGFTLLHWLVPPNFDTLWIWMRASAVRMGPITLLGVLGVLVLVRTRRGSPAMWLGVLGVACFLFYSVTPMSGGVAGFMVANITANLRYGLLAVVILAVVASAELPAAISWAAMAVMFAWDGIAVLAPIRARSDLHVRTSTLAIAVVAGMLVAAATTSAGRRSLARLTPILEGPWTRRLGPAVAALGLAWLAFGSVAVSAPPRPQDTVGAALADSLRPSGRVALIDVTDLTHMLGPGLDRNLVPVGDGAPGREVPITSAAAFNARLQQLAPVVVVVVPNSPPLLSTVPADWTVPSDWILYGHEDGGDVYLTRWR